VMNHLTEDILSPYLVLLVLVGKAFPGLDGQALGDEFAAFAVPPLVRAFFLGEDCTAGRTEDLGRLNIWIVHNDFSFYHIFFDTGGRSLPGLSLGRS